MSKTNPMLDLFFMEAQGQISVLKESLSALENDLSNKKELNSLLRASSSLKAAGKLASLDAIFSLTQAQENIFTLASKNNFTFTKENIITVQESVAVLSQLVDSGVDTAEDWLESNNKKLSQHKLNIEALLKSKTDKEASKKKNNQTANKTEKKDEETRSIGDLSMQELFRMEAETQTSILNNSLLELENTPADLSIIEKLMRAAHSIKGAARMVGLNATVKIAHILEDIFVAAQKSELELSHEDMNVLLISIDMIAAMAKATSNNYDEWVTEQEKNINELTSALNAIFNGDKKNHLIFQSKR